VPDEVKRLAKRLRSTPPSCVGGIRLTRARFPIAPSRVKSYCMDWEHAVKSVWRLGCACGAERGRVLGYPLHEWIPDFDDPIFIGPLAFECSACGKVTEFLDTDVDGYHANVAKFQGGVGSVKVRGDGPRRRFPCPACRGDLFVVTVGFIYWPAAIDLFFDEPDLPIPIQEFFNEFLCYSRCVSRGEVSAITEFGKL
jgi:hypothetical protein